MSDEPAYLLPREVAAMLRVSQKTVYRISADASCPTLRIGGSVRFPRQRFLDWLRRHEQGRGRQRAEATR